MPGQPGLPGMQGPKGQKGSIIQIGQKPAPKPGDVGENGYPGK